MNVKFNTTACDPELLESFLKGDLSADQEREFTLHLNDCENCRRTLEQQAAEPESWAEAEQLLKPSRFDDASAGSDRHGADAASVGVDSPVRLPLEIQTVLDALGPTDDPQMLGRIGGYEVSGVVGSGGMGVVLKAIDKSLDRTVAIKVLAPHLATSGAARRRFAREAKAAAAVLHPNVIAIHSVSNDEVLPYLVMPYVRGASLQKRLDREGPLAVTEILRIGSQIAAGLAAAHAQGLVHRDIKPANILLEDGVERVTITDFGLARAVDDATITHSGMIAGTPQYMSPEQARGEVIGQGSDLFSLGSVLYAVSTGRPPFRSETSYGVMRRISDDEPTPIREINPDIPDWLCAIIMRLMSKRAADRFATAGEVTDLLENCLAHVQQPAAVPLPASLDPHANRKRWNFNSRRTGVFAMLGAVIVTLLGMLAWQATTPPDISGNWVGEDWGAVELESKQPGQYEGVFKAADKSRTGTLQLKWSRVECRFNGTWQEGDVRRGKISLRLVDTEVRGAWTTRNGAGKEPETPRLAELHWKRIRTGADIAQSTEATRTAKAQPDASMPFKLPGGIAAGPETRPTVKLEGTVLDVLDEDLVEISIGSNDGLRVRDTLSVYRDEMFLGRCTVRRVLPDASIGRIDMLQDNIQRGDRVTSEAVPQETPVPFKVVNHFQFDSSVNSLAYSSDGKLIAVVQGEPASFGSEEWKRSVKIWNLDPGGTKITLTLSTAEEDAVFAANEGLHRIVAGPLAFSHDGNMLAVGTGLGQVKLFNTRTGELIRAFDDEPARLAEKKTAEDLKSLKRAMGAVGSLSFSPDDSQLAMSGSSFDDYARTWGGVRRLGRLVTGLGRLKVWDVKTGTLKHDLVGHSHAHATCFSPDGKLLASAGQWEGPRVARTGVIIWNPATGEKLRTITHEANGGTHSVAFSPDSRFVVYGAVSFDKDNDTSATTVSMSRAGTGIVEWRQTFPVWASPQVFSPDGKSVAVLFQGRSIKFLNPETGAMRYEIISQNAKWNRFAFTPAGPRLAICTTEPEKKGSVQIYSPRGPE